MAMLNTLGFVPNEDVDMANAKAMLLIGTHIGENIHLSHVRNFITGMEKGAKIIVVDPRFSSAAAKADVWVKIKPATDTAFLLAVMNYLIEKGRYNKEFVKQWCNGFDEFRKGISGMTVKKAAKICDVSEKQLIEVAEILADNAPHVAIHPGRHATWYGNDFQRERALACLTGLLGAYYVKGGWVPSKGPKVKGVSWAKEDHGHEFDLNFNHEEDEHIYTNKPPGTPTDLIRDCAISGKPYAIKSCVVWGQNPMQTIPNQQKMKDLFNAMDFVMCVDVMPTDVTAWADILLPEKKHSTPA
jgi:thiosulfate reductase/polysulfide reductase chain A